MNYRTQLIVPCLATTLLCCSSSDEPDGSEGPVEASCVESPDLVDILLVTDNSSNAGEIQPRFAFAAGAIVRALVTGDADDDGQADFAPFASINAGVITGDLGIPFAVPTCTFDGDEAQLLDTSAAPGCEAVIAPIQMLRTSGDAVSGSNNVSCLVQAGAGGCGFEQPLESMRMATMAPDHGLLREGAVLMVVMMAAEDDCSAEDIELFNPGSTVYTEGLSARCELNPEALHGIQRYVDGLLLLRPAARLVFAVMSGIPEAFDGRPPSEALADPRVGQPFVPTDGTLPPTVCETQATLTVIAAAPRLVTLARDLDARGAFVDIASVCLPAYGDSARRIAELANAARSAPCP